MPRRVRTRATRRQPDLDPALLGFFVDGDMAAAIESLTARGQRRLVLWRDRELVVLWRENREAIFVEAKKRGLKAPSCAVYFDAFAPGSRCRPSRLERV